MPENPFEKEKQRVRELALKCMEEAMIMVEADTKELCPVLSGTLKRSYTHDVEEKDNKIIGAVGTNVEYAYWADQKQPHLTQAIDMNMNKIKEKFANELGKV
jgi:hypothetical protein